MAKKQKQAMVDRDRYNYQKIRVRDARGKVRHSAGCKDAVAVAMLGLSYADIKKVAQVNKLGTVGKTARNPGQYRMVVGNSLRAKVRRGETVKIGAHAVTSLKQRVPLPEAATSVK